MFLLPMACTADTTTNTSKSSGNFQPLPSCVSFWSNAQLFSDMWTTNPRTTSLKALPCEMFGISCFRFVWAAIAEFTAHSSSAHFLSSTVQFVWYLLVLSCNLKDSDGNHSLLRLFKRYCGFPGSAQKTEKLQYHIIISKRKHGSARVSYQLV